MKALFLVDNIPAMEMFAPVIKALPHNWEALFVNYDGWTKESRCRIDDYARRLSVKCRILERHNRQGVENIINKEKPNILIFAREETTPVDSLFVMLGKANNIPTLLIPHGMIIHNENRVWGISGRFFRLGVLCRLIKQGFRVLAKGNISLRRLIRTGVFRALNDFRDKNILSRYDNFTMVATYGETMKDILLQYKVAPQNIAITGNPKFDAYFNTTSLNHHKNTILLLTNYLVEFGLWNTKQREFFIRDVCDVATNTTLELLKIKIHPVSENRRDYEKVAQKHKLSMAIYQHESLKELINGCDVAITTMSSAGLEVMVAGKPLVIYNPYGDVTPYDENSGAFIVKNKSELFDVVSRVFKNEIGDKWQESTKEFVYRNAYLQDGKATMRIANLIVKMVKGS